MHFARAPARAATRERAAGIAGAAAAPLARPGGQPRRASPALLGPLAGQTDLVVLPETFTTGFSMEVERLGEPAGGDERASGCKAQAAALDAAVTGSVITRRTAATTTGCCGLTPDRRGAALRQAPSCFAWAGEHEHFTAGRERLERAAGAGCACVRWCATTCASRSSAAGAPQLDYDLLHLRRQLAGGARGCVAPAAAGARHRESGLRRRREPGRHRRRWTCPTPATASPSISSGGHSLELGGRAAVRDHGRSCRRAAGGLPGEVPGAPGRRPLQPRSVTVTAPDP